jgi:predicted RND superfamily exporter protein
MKKKGQNMGIGALIGVGVVFVILSIVLAFGADVVDDVSSDFTENSYADNISNDGLASLETISERQDTLATVVVVTLIIGLLLTGLGGYAYLRA